MSGNLFSLAGASYASSINDTRPQIASARGRFWNSGSWAMGTSMGTLSLGVILSPDPDRAHQRNVCDVVHSAKRYDSGIVFRLHTAGATRIRPSALGGSFEANAVIATAPPMLSPST